MKSRCRYRTQFTLAYRRPRTVKMIDNSQLFLLGLEGTEVTLPSSDSLKIRGDTWVIDKKLNEVSCMTTREDLDTGRPVPSYTMGKFLYHKVGALPESAFMRIYSQVPIEDIQFRSPEVRAFLRLTLLNTRVHCVCYHLSIV